jgi:hypothetical protein
VLCGTSNEDEIINDPTGNRRILPVNVLSIDYEKYYLIDKTALWMELYWELQEVGESWMLSRQEISYLNQITQVNEQASLECEAIQMFFDRPDKGGFREWMSNTEIVNFIETHTRLKISPFKLGMNLKKLGFEKISKRIDGMPRNVYEVIKRGDYNKNASDSQSAF